MVVALHPQPASSPATRRSSGAPVGLRLVVDNTGHRSRSAGHDRGLEDLVSRLYRPLPVAVALAAVVVFGGLLSLRIAQGGATADNWDDVERLARSESAVAATDLTAGGRLPAAGDQVLVAQPGDSYWSLAKRIAPDSDPRPVVAALIEANGGESVQIGQQIIVPRQLLD